MSLAFITGMKFPVSAVLLTLAIGSIIWSCYQQKRIQALEAKNTGLAVQLQTQQVRLQQLKVQAAGLSAALTERQTQQHSLEERNEQTRRKLRQEVGQSSCAGQPVPADIIRLQRDELRRTSLPQ